MSTQSTRKFLFGGSRHWSPLEWTSSDDRVRGGSSQSYIDASPLSPIAVFYGNLDTKTLGGAGFASQRTTTSSTWDLSKYDGILLDIEKTDGKKYTLILKDEILPKSPNGREQSTISWEYDFGTEELTKHGQGGEIFVPWEELVPTYRGREKKDVEPLNLEKVQRFSIMMRRCRLEAQSSKMLGTRRFGVEPLRTSQSQRANMPVAQAQPNSPQVHAISQTYSGTNSRHGKSFFDSQSGPFSMSITSISASKKPASFRNPYRHGPNPSSMIINEKLPFARPVEPGFNNAPQTWSSWLSGGCFR